MRHFAGILVTLLVALLLGSLAAACSSGGNSETTTPTPASATPGATTTAPATVSPSGTLTLTITSVTPNPVHQGGKVTVTFKTEPAAAIGFQITDSSGKIQVQTLAMAGGDGIAIYTSQPISGPAGAWQVQAAAGRSIQDLLTLQASPSAGPETANATFQVQ